VQCNLDLFDLKILREIQSDSSRSTGELASCVGLSQTPCWRRLQRLRTEGYVKAEVALLDRQKLGLKAQIFALIKLSAHGRSHLPDFAKAIQSFPEVMECYVLMGSMDFMLRIVTNDIETYEKFFFERLSQVSGVQEINSIVALSEIKSTNTLPI
jgi:Lrp/AsnC family transcriptional regulator